MDTGWIKLYRTLTKHWLWKEKPFTKAQAWIDILLECNHSDEKKNFGNQIFLCKRGEKLYSLDTWAKRWGWSKSMTRRFFNLLQKDSMISLKSTRYTTHLTVLNYNTYQGDRNGSETEVKRKWHGSETEVAPIKEYKELKNEKNDKKNNIPSVFDSIDFKNTFLEFKKMRTKIRKPMTDRAIELTFYKLLELSNGNKNIAIKILEQSIENSWQGVFELKNKSNDIDKNRAPDF